MPLPPEVSDWIARSEVDHIGPFVNAWAAFNAWYRHAFGPMRDAEALVCICTKPNPLRSSARALLDPDAPESVKVAAFRQRVADLHVALEGYKLDSAHKGKLEEVSFRSVPVPPLALPLPLTAYDITYAVSKAGKNYTTTVANKAGEQILEISQPAYDLSELLQHPGFLGLSGTQRSKLKSQYEACNPRPLRNLLIGDEPVIVAGAISFRCTHDDLFSGIIQTVYRMRNMLLHGELQPVPQALACYQPAYHLLRRLLDDCT